jgi:hypothetical protein
MFVQKPKLCCKIFKNLCKFTTLILCKPIPMETIKQPQQMQVPKLCCKTATANACKTFKNLCKFTTLILQTHSNSKFCKPILVETIKKLQRCKTLQVLSQQVHNPDFCKPIPMETIKQPQQMQVPKFRCKTFKIPVTTLSYACLSNPFQWKTSNSRSKCKYLSAAATDPATTKSSPSCKNLEALQLKACCSAGSENRKLQPVQKTTQNFYLSLKTAIPNSPRNRFLVGAYTNRVSPHPQQQTLTQSHAAAAPAVKLSSTR